MWRGGPNISENKGGWQARELWENHRPPLNVHGFPKIPMGGEPMAAGLPGAGGDQEQRQPAARSRRRSSKRVKRRTGPGSRGPSRTA
eukprot:2111041-Pyramimonas_sp.AAC.1